jgi:hypothetical protein
MFSLTYIQHCTLKIYERRKKYEKIYNTINGFLRENNLLTLESQVIDCNIKSII